jgi:pilus assembly protein CpaF
VSLAPPASTDLLRLRHELHQRLVANFDFGDAGKSSPAGLEAECRRRVESLLDSMSLALDDAERSRVIAGVLDDAFRLGPLEPLLADPEVTDVLVTGPDRVFVERHGQLQHSDARFRDSAHIMHVIQRVVRNAGRRIDERSPMVDARLPDGSRVNAIIPPLAVDAPQLSIRRFPATALTLERLVELGTLPAATAELIRSAVRGRLNVIFSGGAGVGKTTVLNAASASIGHRERVITVEDAAELRLLGEHVVRLETRAANVESVGAVEPRDLVRNALRMRPDRIIVGECRGAEAFDMMQAMNTGHEGSMTTLHANSARDTLARLEMMLAMGGFDMPVRVIRDYVASAIQLVIHLTRLPDGRRVMSEAIEVVGADADRIQVRTLHTLELHSTDQGAAGIQFSATGEQPSFLSRLRSRGVHVDPLVFRAGTLAWGSRS